ncbi:MAG: response regulator transcription factor [Acidobacteriia bacterium]|nr:response regulator transcription factor [Terriglobia bacterium]
MTVDSQQLVQEGLAAMINREPDMTVVATASTGEAALTGVWRYRPDVVTLDLLLPDIPGEELARRILADFPQTRIVAITSARSHIRARRALDAGIHGYLSKAAPVCEFLQAIRQVQAGARVIPGPVMLQDADYRPEGADGNARTSEVQRGRPSLAGNPAHGVSRNRQRRDNSSPVSGGRSERLLFHLDGCVVEEDFHRQSTGCGAGRSC